MSSLTLGQASFYDDVYNIMLPVEGYRPFFLTKTVLHTKTKDLQVWDGVWIADRETNRDYLKDMSDYMEISLFIRPGTFVHDVYPSADNLELTLTVIKQHRINGRSSYTEETFKAIYLHDVNKDLDTKTTAPRETLDKNPPYIVTFQLVDKGAMALRTVEVQGVFTIKDSETNKNLSPDDLLKSITDQKTKGLKASGKDIVDKITIEKTDNKEPKETIVVPTGTKLIGLADYIQNKQGGLYRAGVNNYLQNYSLGMGQKVDKTFFTYPLFDSTRYHRTESVAMFYVSTSGAYNSSSCNYLYRNRLLRVFTNPVKNLADPKGNVLRNMGDGFKSASAESVNLGAMEVKDDGPHYKRTQTYTEVVAKQQEDGLPNAPDIGISGNHFRASSEIFSRSGRYVQLLVDNIDPDFVYPCMPCMITMEVGDGVIREYYGVIHNVVAKFEYNNYDGLAEKEKEWHGLFTKVLFTIFITNLSGEA